MWNGSDQWQNNGQENELAKWMDFYRRSGQEGVAGSHQGVPIISSDSPTASNRRAMEFALKMSGQNRAEDMERQRMQPPDFWGQAQQQSAPYQSQRSPMMMQQGYRMPDAHEPSVDYQMNNYLARLAGK